ncbi:hypothetical protein D3C78_1128290 [compost metagenome]
MSCHGHRLIGDPFHQTAISDKRIRIMIDYRKTILVEFRGQMSFSHCHPDCIRDSLPQGTCCRIYSIGMAKFRMSRRLAVQLTELLQIINRYLIAGQMQEAVQQCRAVTC